MSIIKYLKTRMKIKAALC